MLGLSIIGLGAIGERLLPIIQADKQINIISVYDVNQQKMNEINERFRVPLALSTTDILNDKHVDAVYLAVPPKYHKDLAIDILKAGKHILCEKPLAGTIEEAKAMYDIAKSSYLINAMNFPLYHGATFQKIKQMINHGLIGTVKRIEIFGRFPQWPRFWQVNDWIDTKDQGGFVREVFTHYIQLVHSLFGCIELDYSSVKHPFDKTKSEIDIIAKGHINDIPVLFNGTTGVCQEENLGMIISGTKAVVEFLNWHELYVSDNDERVQIDFESDHPTHNLLDSFKKAFNDDNIDLVDFKMGYEVVKVVERLLDISSK